MVKKMARKKQPAEIYQIKVTLKYSKPPIWRRLLVPSDTTLTKLHDILQVAFGWEGYHLHQFIVTSGKFRTYYGVPDPNYFDSLDMKDERKFTLKQIAPGEKSKFVYEYDFGDSWEHVVLVEKVLPPDPAQNYPVCIKGRLACPPEDVGGMWGYYEFLEAIQNPEHPEHEMYIEWIGDEFDPKAFDLDEINAALRKF